jgi:aspartate kinase
MKVFKFGGASVKDTASVRNISSILKTFSDDLVVVISAMGKTTNALERMLHAYMARNRSLAISELNAIREYHMEIARDLLTDKYPMFGELTTSSLEWKQTG